MSERVGRIPIGPQNLHEFASVYCTSPPSPAIYVPLQTGAALPEDTTGTAHVALAIFLK